jgi:hypothetical protein
MKMGSTDEDQARHERQPNRRKPAFFFRTATVFAVPFLWLAWSVQLAGETSEEYLERFEWRGVTELPGEVRISLYDRASEGSFWIVPGEVRAGVEVVAYDRVEEQVVLRHGDATRTLSLATASVAPLEAAEPEAPEAQPEAEDPAPVGEWDEDRTERVAGNWQEAAQRSPVLREVTEGVDELVRQRELLANGMRLTDPESPEFASLLERQARLAEEEERLTERALEELQENPFFDGPEVGELRSALQAGFLSRLASPEQVPHDRQEEP